MFSVARSSRLVIIYKRIETLPLNILSCAVSRQRLLKYKSKSPKFNYDLIIHHDDKSPIRLIFPEAFFEIVLLRICCITIDCYRAYDWRKYRIRTTRTTFHCPVEKTDKKRPITIAVAYISVNEFHSSRPNF